jgi:hypothetical protein
MNLPSNDEDDDDLVYILEYLYYVQEFSCEVSVILSIINLHNKMYVCF